MIRRSLGPSLDTLRVPVLVSDFFAPYATGIRYHFKVRHWFLHWVLKAVSLLIVASILPGIQVDGFGSAMVAAAVIGLVSVIVGSLLKLILLPFIFLSLGLVYFIINGLMLKLASDLVPGFRVYGLMSAIVGSVLLSLVDFVLNRLAGL